MEQKKYILCYEDLEPGDVILERWNDDISLNIRKHSNSEYSHAALYVSKDCIIEAGLEYGVQAENPQRILLDNIDGAMVLRYPNLTQKICEKIEDSARQQAYKPYSIREAFHAADEDYKTRAAENSRQYCTRLVAQAYKNAGIEIVDNADYCTPQDFITKNVLKPIDGMVREATQEDIQMAMSNGVKTRQPKDVTELFNTIRSITEEDILNETDLCVYLLSNKEKDGVLYEAIKDSKYFGNWREYEQENPERFDKNELLKKNDFPSFLIASKTYYMDGLNAKKRYLRILDIYREWYKATQSKTIYLYVELYTNLVASAERMMKATIFGENPLLFEKLKDIIPDC